MLLWRIGSQKYQVRLNLMIVFFLGSSLDMSIVNSKPRLTNQLNRVIKSGPVVDPLGSGWRVLLLEAGPDESEASDIPVLANSMQGGLFDWQYKVMGNLINQQLREILNSCAAVNLYKLVKFSDGASAGSRRSWA